MTSSDLFTAYYKSISNMELLDIPENPESYQPLAIDAAKIEFERRQLSEHEIYEAKIHLEVKKLEKRKQKEVISQSIYIDDVLLKI